MNANEVRQRARLTAEPAPIRNRVAACLVALGLVASSCSSSSPRIPLPEFDIQVTTPLTCDLVGCVGEGIDTTSGAYTSDVEDLLFPSGVFGIEAVRHYRSDRATVGWFGRGWSTVYETTLDMGVAKWLLDAPAGLAPLWTPEAPSDWRIAGSARVTSLQGGEAELKWPSGEAWTFAVDGSLRSLLSPYGQRVTITRSSNGIVTIDSSQGVTIDLTTVDGVVTSLQSSDGRKARFDYSSELLASVEAPGIELSYSYDAAGRMVRQDSPSGTTTTEYLADAVSEQTTTSGLQISLSYEAGATAVTTDHTLTYEHDNDGRLIRIADLGKDVLKRRYDDLGRLVESTDYVLPGPHVLRAVNRRYDGDRLASETINGVESTFEYDDLERTSVVQTGTDSVSFEYDGDLPLPFAVVSPQRGRDKITTVDGFITGTVDATGAQSTTTRDALGNPVSHSVPGGAPWTYAFDPEGNITLTKAPGGREWTATWGPRSRLLTESDPLGRQSNYSYDKNGRVINQRLPGGLDSEYNYDEYGRLVSETAADDRVTEYEYDEAGRLTTTVLPGGVTWLSASKLDGAGGSFVTVTAPDGSETVSQFDSVGREIERWYIGADGALQETHQQTYVLETATEATVVRGSSRFESRTSYDELGRAASVTESLNGDQIGSITYRYSGAHLAQAANGSATATYDYDAAGRLIAVKSASDSWQAVYRSGVLVSTVHNEAVSEIGYDIDGRATTVVDGAGTTTNWTYDTVDRPVLRSIGDSTAAFAWNDVDLLSEYLAADGSQWSWSYDPVGRLLNASEPGGVTTTYEYSAFGVKGITSNGGGSDRNDTFSYDQSGRLHTADTAAGTYVYDYDATGRVTSIEGEDLERWTYDAIGQVIGIDTGSDRFTLDYDRLGRLDQITGPGTNLQATWSGEVLSAVEVTDRDALRLNTDLNGRLIKAQWDDDTAIDLAWLQSGDQIVLTESGTDNKQTYDISDGMLVGFTTDELAISSSYQSNGYLQSLLLEQGDASGEVRFDELGRTASLVTGESSATIEYDPEGRVSSVLASGPQAEPEQTTVTYDDGAQQIEGNGQLVESLFNRDGGRR